MSKKTMNHLTGTGEILFMAAAKPFKGPKSTKAEFSIKVKLDENDPAVAILREVAPYKVDTKTNRKLAGTGKVVVTFVSDFAPTMYGVDGSLMANEDVPFFDGRTDTGTTTVAFSVVEYDTTSIVRLAGIKLKTLNIAPREGNKGMSEIKDLLASI